MNAKGIMDRDDFVKCFLALTNNGQVEGVLKTNHETAKFLKKEFMLIVWIR